MIKSRSLCRTITDARNKANKEFSFDAYELWGDYLMLSRDELARILESKPYVFAKTMPENPHHYTLRKQWGDDDLFDEAVNAIREYGVKEWFKGYQYIYFYANGYKYWSMGAPIPETILLNRAIAEYDTVFDDIALTYDTIFDGEFFKEENKLLFNKLGYEHGSVLDVGCGTGIFLDYEIPEAYVGVDISKTMLEVLKDKHDHRKMRLINTTIKDLYLPEKYNYVIALYGQGSYLSDSEMSKLVDYAKDDGKVFIMIYKEGIIPYVNRFTNLEPDYNTLHDYENTIKSRGLTVEEFHNYHILTR